MEDHMGIDKKLIDQLLTDYKKPEDIIGENGLLKELTKAILERALQAEMTDHLGYEKHDSGGPPQWNTRNGKSQKTLEGRFRELELEIPRDRNGHLRSQDRGQGPAPLDRLRRQDHLHVRAGDDHAGDPGSPGGDLRDRGLADANFERDRCGDRRGEGMAERGRWNNCIRSSFWTR